MPMVAAVEIKLAHAKPWRSKAVNWMIYQELLNKSIPDSSRYCHLHQKVKLTCDPICEGSGLRLGNHGRPEIWTASG